MVGVVWVVPILALVCCDLQDPHAINQCYEEVPIGINPTVWKCVGTIFCWVSGSFKGGW